MYIRITTLANRCLLLSLFVLFIFSLSAQNNAQTSYGTGVHLGKTAKLSTLVNSTIDAYDTKQKFKEFKNSIKEIPNFKTAGPFPKRAGSLPIGGDPLVKKHMEVSKTLPIGNLNIIHNIDAIQGSTDAGGIQVPDCNGDIGLNYYLMATNGPNSSVLHIYDKLTGELVEATTLGPLWAEIDRVGAGDPIIFFDRIENRWILTEFIFGNAVLMAISETSDPLGVYDVYEFQTPQFPDYPKFGNWTDAYYLTTNEPGGFNPVYAIDKEAMLAGEETVGFIEFDNISKLGAEGLIEVCTPIEYAGQTLPPAERKFAAFRPLDDDWDANIQDMIQYYEFSPDFEDPANSTIDGPFDLITEPFELDMCVDGLFTCISQTDGSPLSTIPAIIMHRVQYRNFGDYESIVLAFSVDITGDNEAGVRWMELRRMEDSGWDIYQEGTISLNDGTSRFMGAISQDSKGNIIVGYAMAGENLDPSVAVTARSIEDELGVMTLAETFLAEGTRPSDGLRWGDYFSMTLDPVDDQTFWFTSEYMQQAQVWTTRLTAMTLRRDTIDASPRALISPVTDANLTATESVKISIQNPGLSDISNIGWGVIFEGNELETGAITDLLPASASVDIDLVNTVDMSAFGNYNFKIYTVLDGDENIGNDTLRALIRHIPAIDFSGQPNSNNNPFSCEDEIEYNASFMNEGLDTINTFTANLLLNGALTSSVEVMEMVLPGENIDVVFSDIVLIEGENAILYYASNLNGQADQVIINDEYNDTITYDPMGHGININFQSDAFANETSWELQDINGEVIFQGGGYTGVNATEDIDLCIEEGCYSFVLADAYGDGWGYGGNPFLEITQGDTILLAELTNFNFGTQWIAEFCVPFVCDITAEVEFINESSEGAADGSIIITFENANEETEYSIDGGITFVSNSIFNNLPVGNYMIVVRDQNGCEYTETISIVVNTSELPEDALFVIQPNPNSGYFNFNLDYENGPTEITVTMLNQQGVRVRKDNIRKFSNGYRKKFLVPNLPAGTYYLVVSNDEFHSIKKVIKH